MKHFWSATPTATTMMESGPTSKPPNCLLIYAWPNRAAQKSTESEPPRNTHGFAEWNCLDTNDIERQAV